MHEDSMSPQDLEKTLTLTDNHTGNIGHPITDMLAHRSSAKYMLRNLQNKGKPYEHTLANWSLMS